MGQPKMGIKLRQTRQKIRTEADYFERNAERTNVCDTRSSTVGTCSSVRVAAAQHIANHVSPRGRPSSTTGDRTKFRSMRSSGLQFRPPLKVRGNVENGAPASKPRA